jgi:hypothetical protein
VPGGDERQSFSPVGERWSFGGASAIETPAGTLVPDVLVAGVGHAVLHAFLMPAGSGQSTAAVPSRPTPREMLFGRWSRRGRERWSRRRQAGTATAALRTLAQWAGAVTLVDDRGTAYALRPEGVSGTPGQPLAPQSVRFRVDPVPGRGTGWIELRQDGTAVQLLPLPLGHPPVRVGQLAQIAVSPAERELSDQALSLIALQLSNGAGPLPDIVARRCSAALARTAEVQHTGELDPASELPGQLAKLCAVLTEHHPVGELPSGWSGMLNTARQADGPRRHFDIGAALPPVDGVAVRVDSLISSPGGWRLYLRAVPGWWDHSEAGHRQQNTVSVLAEDDIGGTYVGIPGGSSGSGPRGYEEFTLMFLPRLDPLAQTLKLTFRGPAEELPVAIQVEPAMTS